MFSDGWGQILSDFQLETASMEAVWGICNQGDFFWGVSFGQIPSFQSNVWKRSHAACGKKDLLNSGFWTPLSRP